MESSDSDSDDQWWDNNRRKPIIRPARVQTFRAFFDQHKDWFKEGIKIEGYEHPHRPPNRNGTVDPPSIRYHDIMAPFDESEYLGKPHIYQKSVLKIKSPEEAVCIQTNVTGVQRKRSVQIKGRISCGQAYTDDIVYVQIENDGMPHRNGQYFGKVISFIERQRFKDIENPVLICTKDRHQGHLMLPVCTTVPKINVLHGRIAPNRLRTSVEIHRYDSQTRHLKFDKHITINEDNRQVYLFAVVLIKWKITNIYPLGAVVGAVNFHGDIDEAMTLLRLQYNLPKWNEYSNLESIQNLKVNKPLHNSETLLVFTIGESGEKVISYGFDVSRDNSNRNTRVGVHVTDIAKIIQKGDELDSSAKEKGFSFNGSNIRHCMIPEQITNHYSLVTGENRHVLSVYVDVNDDGTVVQENLCYSVVQSAAHFSYLNVECIIDNQIPMPDIFTDDIRSLHALATRLREKRLECSSLAIEAKIDFLSRDCYMSTIKARNMVEEILILANNTAGNLLRQRFHDNIPVYGKPTLSNTDIDNRHKAFYKNNENILDLTVKCQGQQFLNFQRFSLHYLETHVSLDNDQEQNLLVLIPERILLKLGALLDEDRYDEAIFLLSCDTLFPKQAIAMYEMNKLSPSFRYTMLRDNILDSTVQFTHPFHRYCDIVVQRLIHAYIDGGDSPYSWNELREMCALLNKALKNKQVFHDIFQKLSIATYLKHTPISFPCFIYNISDEGIEIVVPGLLHFMTNLELKFKDIGVCNVQSPENSTKCAMHLESKAEIFEDVEDTYQCLRLVVEWRLRLYSYSETISHVPNGTELEMIYPHDRNVFLRYNFWKDVISYVINRNNQMLKTKLCSISTDDVQSAIKQEKTNLECFPNSVQDISSETTETFIFEQAVHFGMCLHRGQTVSVQLTSIEESGQPMIVPQILNLTKNIKLCLPHVQDPIRTFSRYAEKSSIHDTVSRYASILEYQQIWIPIVEMEVTLNTVRDSLPIIINNIQIKFRNGQGMIELSEEFCDKRNLYFGYIQETDDNEMVAMVTDRKKYHNLPSGDFICIMMPQNLNNETKNKIGNDFLHEDEVLWTGHGLTTKICKYVDPEREGQRKQKMVRVVFELHEKSSLSPVNMFTDCRLEILQKSSSDRRMETCLKDLQKATDLAQRISLGRDISPLDHRHVLIANHIINEGLNVGLWENNTDQHWAIKRSLKSKFKLIQGPPGTGKTYVGLKLIYLFKKFNCLMQELYGGEKKQIVFCGPSNKSVDLVARLVVEKLGDQAPKIVRIYGSRFEQLDYAIPGTTFDDHLRLKDLKVDPVLERNGLVLHQIIRRREKPYADRLRQLDEQFHGDVIRRRNGEQTRTTVDHVKEYKDIQSKATKEELPNYDVIFCTASMVANPKIVKAIQGKVYQLIIDESGMCSEPSTIVPIMASAAEQVVLIGDHKQLRPIVKCKEAAKLGLETSLFERYSNNRMYKTMLKIQYRMHPAICEFPSRRFYDDKLRTATNLSYTPLSIWPQGAEGHIPHVFCHIEGTEERLVVKTEAGNEQSRYNQDEVEHVVRLFGLLRNQMNRKNKKDRETKPAENVIVLSQYNAQCSALREALPDAANVSTVVQSQGGEWDYVIFSLVRSLPDYEIPEQPTMGWRNHALGFITDQNQINVALTRAKRGLIIIGNAKLLSCDPVWKDLIDDYRNKGCVFNAREFPRTV